MSLVIQVVQDTVKRAVDTIVIHDTVTIVDSVRVGPSAAVELGKWLIGSGVFVTVILAIGRWRKTRTEKATAIEFEAYELRRHMRAAFEKHLVEPPNRDALIAWTRQALKGFDVLTAGFDKLTKLTPGAPGAVVDAVADAYTLFKRGSATINRIFQLFVLPGGSIQIKGGGLKIGDPEDQGLRTAYTDLRGSTAALTRAMGKRLRDRDDGYNAP